MKAYHSIEELATDAGISERQAWRWLKGGRIRKVKGEDGRVVFTLSTDKSVSDMSVTDVSDTSYGDKKNDTTDKKEGGMHMSIENRVSASLNALQALHMLKSEANDVVKSFEGAARIPCLRKEVERDLKFLRGIHEALSELYEKFEKGSQLGDGELRELFTTVLETKGSWERFWLNQIQELSSFDEEERVSLIKTGLKKELPAFDTVLESIKFFLALGKG